MTLRDIAQQYINAGFSPVPLEPGSKDTRIPGWNDPARVFAASEFPVTGNLGLRWGVGPKFAYDADLDDPRAAEIIDLFLPPTGARYGRAGKRESHRLYTCDQPLTLTQYTGLGGPNDMLLELRGLNANGTVTQSMAPPSLWTDKDDPTHTERVEWESGCSLGAAAQLDESGVAWFTSGFRNAATALLIARDFPGTGNHHEPRLALAGFLLRLPLTPDEVERIGRAVMQLVQGDQRDWTLVLATTQQKKRAGKRYTAGTKLADVLGPNGPRIIEKIRGWFGKGTATADDTPKPTDQARQFLAEHYVAHDHPTLHYQQGEFYRFESVAFAEHELMLLRSELYAAFPEADKRTIDEIVDAIKAYSALSRHRASPSWLIDQPTNPRDFLACRNGLLHVPTRQLMPPTPSFFTLNAVDVAYDAHAPRPATFLDTFLASLFPQPDAQALALIQDIFGYALTPDRRFQKIPLIVGPKRGGKGTLIKILRRLLGAGNVCHPTLTDLGETFGKQVLIGKLLAVVNDLRIGPRTDLTKIAENLLAISGGDPQTVHRKNREDWNGELFCLFIILSNLVPNLHDDSGALASRMLFLNLTESFLGREDFTLYDRISATELPGILNWALEGRERLFTRGHFVQPESGKASMQLLEDLTSPVRNFLRERCQLKTGAMVPHHELYGEWKLYCDARGIKDVGRDADFAKNVHALMPNLKVSQPRAYGQKRCWVGIEVKGGPF